MTQGLLPQASRAIGRRGRGQSPITRGVSKKSSVFGASHLSMAVIRITDVEGQAQIPQARLAESSLITEEGAP